MKRRIDEPMRAGMQRTMYIEKASLRPIFSWTEEGKERRCPLNKTLRTRVHKQVANLPLSLTTTSHHDSLPGTTRAGASSAYSGETSQFTAELRDASSRVLVTNSPAQNSSNSGESGRTTNADYVNASFRGQPHGRKASDISRHDAPCLQNPEARCIMEFGKNC